MTLRTEMDHLPWPIRQELHRIAAMLFEAFTEMTRGRLSEQYRAGRILKLILHGPHGTQAWDSIQPGGAFHLLVIVNYPRLARKERDWGLVRERLSRAWTFGEITHPVRLTIESLERVNRALIEGIPHFVTIAADGIALYQSDERCLQAPRILAAAERSARGLAEFARWHEFGCDFLLGAAFYRYRRNARMAALLLHQACEHFYLCVLWSITLHGPRSHALDELREAAEALDVRLRAAWPRDTPFERRAFGCSRRAYIEARYGRAYRISPQELDWAFARAEMLRSWVFQACADHHAALDAAPIALLRLPEKQAATAPPPRSIGGTVNCGGHHDRA